MLSIFKNKIFKIFLLGFSSGLPFALTTSTLSIWLTEIGIKIEMIGIFTALTIPYSFKFIWAPFIDNFDLPYLSKKLGRNKSWIILSQISLITSIILLGISNPNNHLIITSIMSLIVVICAATQDISIDSYRIKLLSKEEQGIGATATMYGYRIGMLFSSAGALILSQYYDWSIVYLISAFGLIVGIFAISTIDDIKEDNIYINHTKKLQYRDFIKDKLLSSFYEFAKKNHWILIILFAIFFRLSDIMADVMSNSFYINIGFSKSEIASIVKTWGLIAILIGSFLGGSISYKIGIIPGLWIGGLLQMLSNLSFLYLSYIGYDPKILSIVVAIENISSGIASTIFISYLSSLCIDSKSTATHYAILTAVASIGRNILSIPIGYIVKSYGWYNFYLFTFFAAIPGLILLYLITKRTK